MTKTLFPKRETATALRAILAAGLLAFAVPSSKAEAEDFFYPRLSTETDLQFQYDHVRASDGTRIRNLTFTGEHQTIVDFSRNLTFNSLLSMQQVIDPMPGVSVFQNEGLYAEEAYMKWTNDVVAVRAGKFTQNFGKAWYQVPGLYAADFTSDYQLSEKLGAEMSYAFGLYQYGRHQISVSDFVADRTFLSQSLFTDRGRLTLDDGGPTNTAAPHSYVVSYDGVNIPLGGATLSYQVSGAWLGRGLNDTGSENRASAGFSVNIPLNNDVGETLRGRYSVLRFMGEAVRRTNADGAAGQTIDYLTGGSELVRGNWVFDLSATSRRTELAGDVTKDLLLQSTIGYNFPFDTNVSFGVAREDVGGVQSTIFGARVTYTLTTCDRCEIKAKHH